MGLLSNKLIQLQTKKDPKYKASEKLLWDRKYNSSSWFVIGHFEDKGHRLNYLYHLMVWPDDQTGEPMLNSVVSVTDETTGFYRGEDKFYPLDQAEIAEDHFAIKVPNGSMEGDLEHLHITGELEGVSMDIDLDLKDAVIYNAGSGSFKLAIIDVNQFSKPNIDPSGTLLIDGQKYDVSGDAWFDRQWQKVPEAKGNSTNNDPVTSGKIHWYWLDLNLDCGDKLSLWCVEVAKITRAWATVWHTDGTTEVVDVTPFSKYHPKKWLSPVSGQNYPIEFTVNIPQLDADLHVTPYPVEQEIASEHISKYEAASQVEGTYLGKKSKGFCYVELVGGFS